MPWRPMAETSERKKTTCLQRICQFNRFFCNWSLCSWITDVWAWLHTSVTRTNYREDPSIN